MVLHLVPNRLQRTLSPLNGDLGSSFKTNRTGWLRDRSGQLRPCDKITSSMRMAKSRPPCFVVAIPRFVRTRFRVAQNCRTDLPACVDRRLMEAGLIHFHLEFRWISIRTSRWTRFSRLPWHQMRRGDQPRKVTACPEHQLIEQMKWRCDSAWRSDCAPRHPQSPRPLCPDSMISLRRFATRAN